MASKPPVWQMIKEAIEHLGGEASNAKIKEYIKDKYDDVNENTIDCQIAICSVNRQARVNYTQNRKPRLADSKYDFLFGIERGLVEVYESEKHGVWEIRKDERGTLEVAQVGVGVEFIHTVSVPEHKWHYLNSRSDSGESYGDSFPPRREKLLILDQEGREFRTIQHNPTQLAHGAEGGLKRWYQENQVVPGTSILVKYDPVERSDAGDYVIHLEIVEEEPAPVEQPEPVAKAPAGRTHTVGISPEELKKRLEHQDTIGLVGELIAYQYEVDRLARLGIDKPGKWVGHVSKCDAGAGFDIHSSPPYTEARYIEVKASTQNPESFYITQNEIKFLKEKGDQAYLYLVLITNLQKQQGSVVQEVQRPIEVIESGGILEPVLFKARLGNE